MNNIEKALQCHAAAVMAAQAIDREAVMGWARERDRILTELFGEAMFGRLVLGLG
ncbi:hypothetical protein [Nioella sp.]|uniref:hypothetical protein n=1 Tax=Nioella sp. TaxID=1912091 RepID=UPI003B5292FA